MKHKNDILYILALILLVMLYLISSTDLFYKEQETDIYQISVILNETSDAIFENIKLGMKQVDKEWTTEVNIVTLYEANHAEQQMKLLEREITNGAEAIILFPVDAELTKEYLIQENWNIPIICVGTYLPEQVVDVWIHGDELARVQELGRKIIEDNLRFIYTIAPRIERSNVNQRLKGLKGVLEENNVGVECLYYETEEELVTLLRELNEKEIEPGLVALDTMTLNLLMTQYRTLEEQNLYIYGIGYTSSLLSDLEKGLIQALSIHNDYDLGYLSLASAVALLQHEKVAYDQKVIGGLVTKDNIYGTLYEKILFPIH